MKLIPFLENNKRELIQIYITERNRSPDGILHIDITDDKANVSFIPLSSDSLTDDLKLDVENKRKTLPNNVIFIYGTEIIDNKQCTNLVHIEL